MLVNNNGNIINNIVSIAESIIYKDYIAFQDSDGAIFHIKKSEVIKLYSQLVSKKPIITNDDLNKMTERELDIFLTGGN